MLNLSSHLLADSNAPWRGEDGQYIGTTSPADPVAADQSALRNRPNSALGREAFSARVRKTSSVFRLQASSEGVVAGLSGHQNGTSLDEL